MKYLLFISIILGFSFSNEEKELPPRFDLKKGINIGSVVPKNMNNQLYQPISEHKIDAIKKEAKNFIPKPITENDIIVFETTSVPPVETSVPLLVGRSKITLSLILSGILSIMFFVPLLLFS